MERVLAGGFACLVLGISDERGHLGNVKGGVFCLFPGGQACPDVPATLSGEAAPRAREGMEKALAPGLQEDLG